MGPGLIAALYMTIWEHSERGVGGGGGCWGTAMAAGRVRLSVSTPRRRTKVDGYSCGGDGRHGSEHVS